MEHLIGIWLVRLSLAAPAGYGFGSSAYLLARAAPIRALSVPIRVTVSGLCFTFQSPE